MELRLLSLLNPVHTSAICHYCVVNPVRRTMRPDAVPCGKVFVLSNQICSAKLVLYDHVGAYLTSFVVLLQSEHSC